MGGRRTHHVRTRREDRRRETDRRIVVRRPKVAILTDSILKYCFVEGADVFPYRGYQLSDILDKQLNHRIANWLRYDLLFIHAGTNDLDAGKHLNIVSRLKDLVKLIKEENRHIKIIISSILPRPRDEYPKETDRFGNEINNLATRLLIGVNQHTKSWAMREDGIHYAPTFTTFLNGGELSDEPLWARDGLHLSEAGNIRMITIIASYITRFNDGTVPFGYQTHRSSRRRQRNREIRSRYRRD